MITKAIVMLISTTVAGETHYGPTSFYDTMEQCITKQGKLIDSVPDIKLDVKCLRVVPPVDEPTCKE